MNIKCYISTDEPKKIKKSITPSSTALKTIDCKIFENTSMLDIKVLVNATNFKKDGHIYNYFEISDLNRFYFLTTQPTLMNNGMILLSLHCDVLNSFRTGILKTKCYIERSKNGNAYSSYLTDSKLPLSVKRFRKIEKIPSGNFDTTLKNYITVNGGGASGT